MIFIFWYTQFSNICAIIFISLSYYYMYWSSINAKKYDASKYTARNLRKKFSTEYRTHTACEAVRTKYAASTLREMIAHPSFRLFSLYSPISRMVINVKKGRALTPPSWVPPYLGTINIKNNPHPWDALYHPCLNTAREKHDSKPTYGVPLARWQWRMFVRKKKYWFCSTVLNVA